MPNSANPSLTSLRPINLNNHPNPAHAHFKHLHFIKPDFFLLTYAQQHEYILSLRTQLARLGFGSYARWFDYQVINPVFHFAVYENDGFRDEMMASLPPIASELPPVPPSKRSLPANQLIHYTPEDLFFQRHGDDLQRIVSVYKEYWDNPIYWFERNSVARQ